MSPVTWARGWPPTTWHIVEDPAAEKARSLCNLVIDARADEFYAEAPGGARACRSCLELLERSAPRVQS